MNRPKIRVAVVYQHVAHYRIPVFRALMQDPDIEYTIFAADERDAGGIKTAAPELARRPLESGGLRWIFVKNWWLTKSVLWQSGVVRLALDKRYDGIVFLGSAYYLSTWIGVIVARLTGKHVSMWTHGLLRRKPFYKQWFQVLFYRLAHDLFLYHHRASDILAELGFSRDRMHVIYNSLDYDQQVKLRKPPEEARRLVKYSKMYDDGHLPVLLFIGRLTKRKKLHLLLEAVGKLAARGFRCNVLFVGDGPDREALERLAGELNLVGQVHFFGSAYEEEEISNLLTDADICVAPGDVGLTCMHSLVYGTPVITHDNPDFQMPEYEAIEESQNGMFFKMGSADDLAVKIQAWLEGNPDRKSVAERCYDVIDRLYNPMNQRHVLSDVILSRVQPSNQSK